MIPRRIVRFLVGMALATAWGCEGGGGGADLGAVDPGTDVAAPDPGLDPGRDAAPDAALDAAAEAAADAPVEAGPDAATDTAADLPADLPADVPPDTVPAGCAGDGDCPGCQVCDLAQVGAPRCVDPLAGGAKACTTRLDCPSSYCCAYTLFADKPACGGMCVFDDGTAECHACGDEGMELSGDTEPCCPGLEKIPMPIPIQDLCMPSRCFCSVCVKHCGDGVCSTGENPCTCPADCPQALAKGPGAPCTADADCGDGTCLAEASGYPKGGYCTAGACDPADLMQPCPPGSACTGTWFSQARLCLPTCRKDADCRDGLTCEAFPEPLAPSGTWRCWQAGGGQPAGIGQACAKDDDCLSHLCLEAAGGSKTCSAFCDADIPCRDGFACAPMGGCGAPGCGACFREAVGG